MMQLKKRVERLETRLIAAAPVEVHVIEMELGETEEEAIARYGRPIEECDSVNVILLVPVEPGSVHEAA